MICYTCKQDKPQSSFGKDISRLSGYRGQCKICRPKSDPAKLIAANLKHKFGMTTQEWDKLFLNQNGCCAICMEPQTKKRLAVDHNHTTGEVRGLLCDLCNRGLGYFKDCRLRLEKAQAYLARRKAL